MKRIARTDKDPQISGIPEVVRIAPITVEP